MAPRRGSEFIDGLRRSPREVWVAGRRVDDVTSDPVFRRPVQPSHSSMTCRWRPSITRS